MSGCLKDLCVVSLWMLISSQNLETISFQKPIDLLDKTFKWDGQPPQRPSSRKMHQLLQLLVAINQQNTCRIFTGDSSGIPSEVNVVQAIGQVTKSIIGCIKSIQVWGNWWGLNIRTLWVSGGVVRHPWPSTLSIRDCIRFALLSRNHLLIDFLLSCSLPFDWDAPWCKREFVRMDSLEMGVLWNMARRDA